MIVTNMDHLHEREIKRTLGIVFGYASGTREGGGGPDEFKMIFQDARKMLTEEARKIGAQAVLKIDGKITRDDSGIAEMMLVGTAVLLEDGEDDIEIESSGEWTMPSASPTSEVVKMIRDRERSDRVKEKERKDIYDLADEIGISYDRAKLLMEYGFGKMEDIASATSNDLSVINGINPTQARILRKKAREILDQEKVL